MALFPWGRDYCLLMDLGWEYVCFRSSMPLAVDGGSTAGLVSSPWLREFWDGGCFGFHYAVFLRTSRFLLLGSELRR